MRNLEFESLIIICIQPLLFRSLVCPLIPPGSVEKKTNKNPSAVLLQKEPKVSRKDRSPASQWDEHSCLTKKLQNKSIKIVLAIFSKSASDKSVFLPNAPVLSYGCAILLRNCTNEHKFNVHV